MARTEIVVQVGMTVHRIEDEFTSKLYCCVFNSNLLEVENPIKLNQKLFVLELESRIPSRPVELPCCSVVYS